MARVAVATQNKRALGERGGAFKKALGALGRCVPGERLKTAVYLNCIGGYSWPQRKASIGSPARHAIEA